jgi:ribose transport system substrate-binding protein
MSANSGVSAKEAQMETSHRRRRTVACVLAGLAALVAAGCSSASSGGTGSSSTSPSTAASGPANIAYLSFAVANSYDAPMLAAAQAVAKSENAKLTVFDANNSPQTQFSQLQNAISSGQYQGIIVQPIFGTALTGLVKQAIAKGIKVVNIDQILGPNLSTDQPQVPGLSANVTFVPTEMGKQLGALTVKACASKNLNPCNVGYLYDIKASSLDVAINKGFKEATAGTPVKVVAQGQDFFTPAGGLKAVQDMLTANPNLDAVAGSDQGIEGAVQALAAAKKTGKVLLIGYGGSAAGLAGTKAGAWYGTIIQDPATEGQVGVSDLVKAIRSGTVSGGVNPLNQLPDQGVVTKANAGQFTAEWPG